MNIDEIVNYRNKRSYSKEEYKAYKSEERKNIYALADETANKVFDSSDMLKQYLDVQARFSNYSVNNVLLITAQMPEAKLIKSLEEWKKLGVFKKSNENFIKILEPRKKYLNSDDNSIHATFSTKNVLDVSQTTLVFRDNNKKHNPEEMLKAFLFKCPFNIKAVDDLNSDKSAEYKKDDNVIYIKRGSDSAKIFNDLSYAFVEAGLKEASNSDINKFICDCSSYLICKNMNIDANSFDLSIPTELKNQDVKNKKGILKQIKNYMEDNLLRINGYYAYKEQKSKDFER